MGGRNKKKRGGTGSSVAQVPEQQAPANDPGSRPAMMPVLTQSPAGSAGRAGASQPVITSGAQASAPPPAQPVPRPPPAVRREAVYDAANAPAMPVPTPRAAHVEQQESWSRPRSAAPPFPPYASRTPLPPRTWTPPPHVEQQSWAPARPVTPAICMPGPSKPAQAPVPAPDPRPPRPVLKAAAVETREKEEPKRLRSDAGGEGKEGRRVEVGCNHFPLTLHKRVHVHKYSVEIARVRAGADPAAGAGNRPQGLSRGLSRTVIRKLLADKASTSWGLPAPEAAAYDGGGLLFTAGALSLGGHTRARETVTFPGSPGADPPIPDRSFTVTVTRADSDDFPIALLQSVTTSRAALQALDVVVRAMPASSPDHAPIGRYFFYTDQQKVVNLGEGLDGLNGFFQSIRSTQQGLSLNLDTSATAVWRHVVSPAPPNVVISGVLSLVQRRLEAGRHADPAVPPPDRYRHSSDQVATALSALKGYRIQVTYGRRSRYTVTGVSRPPHGGLQFQGSDGRSITVLDYFKERYGLEIRYRDLPCLNVGEQGGGDAYIPLELCDIVPRQRYTFTSNGGDAHKKLLGMTSGLQPEDRIGRIVEAVRSNNLGNEYATQFGVRIGEQESRFPARCLPAPTLSSNAQEDPELRKVFSWACAIFEAAADPRDAVNMNRRFGQSLTSQCARGGVSFHPQPLWTEMHHSAEALCKMLMSGRPDLLIVILPAKGRNYQLYREIKLVCETRAGVMSQCVSKRPSVPNLLSKYIQGVARKVIMKMGGRNEVLGAAGGQGGDYPHSRVWRNVYAGSSSPAWILFGADVAHPGPGEAARSVAAVVATQDWPHMTKYAGRVRSQGGRLEIIQSVGEMVKELLEGFRKRTGQGGPAHILFYRDGVGEGQFDELLRTEVPAVREAAELLGFNRCKITFVVVQKRHHTRFFPVGGGGSGVAANVPAGTVVDTHVCHPTQLDFYLCSHQGRLGTSRPAHYHVLLDDNNFTSDELQSLTYHLCYTYGRCRSPVSIVPPAYYAHHLAERARHYMTVASARDPNTRVQVVPQPTIAMQSKMFFC